MRGTADELISDYSSLNEEERKKFDKRHADLLEFRRQLTRASKLVRQHPEASAKEIARMARREN